MSFDVFISYSSDDKQVADTICRYLEDNNIKCWYAPRNIIPGSTWAGSIMEAIEECPIMILIFSEKSNNSPQVLREIEEAVHCKNIVIPYRIENVLPNKDVSYYIKVAHWLDGFPPNEQDSSIKKLFDAVQSNLTRARKPVFPAPAVDATVRQQVSTVETPSISPTEHKYITAIREALSDGQISDIEKAKLEGMREFGNILPERANELEVLVKIELGLIKRPLNEVEQKYVSNLKVALEDGQISDIEKAKLEGMREFGNISQERANELEELVKKDLGLLEPPVEPTQAEASQDLSETIANKITEELNARYSQIEQKLNFTFQVDWRGWGFFIVADIYIGPVSFQLVGYFNNDGYGVEFWDVGVKYIVRDWVESSIKDDFPDLEINMRKSYGFVNLWHKDREKGALEKSNEQLIEDFKSGVVNIYDTIFPKLAGLCDKKIDAVNKILSMTGKITQRLEKEFDPEDGWVVENGIKYLGESEGIAVHHADWNNKISLRLEADQMNFNELFFGLCRGEWEKQYRDGTEEVIKGKFDEIFNVADTTSNSNERWIAWNYIEDVDKNTTTGDFLENDFAYLLDASKEEALVETVVDNFVKMKDLKGLIENALKSTEPIESELSTAEPASAMEFEDFAEKFSKLKDGYQQLHREYLETNKTEAVDFNLFHLLGVAHLEVSTHSAMLRELLDSNGSHGQGNLFFVEFLSMLADKDIIPKEDVHKYSPKTFDDYLCEAERSVATGRIDIIIERLQGDFPFCIIIENKVYAVDQYEQIERYWAELEKKTQIPLSRKEIIYLTPKGCLPSEDSIDCQTRGDLESKGALHYLSYNKDIKQWLERVLPKVKSPKVEGMLRHYIEIVKDL